MHLLKKVLLSTLFILGMQLTYANGCCKTMGGVNYCDSSAGRVVCKNGFYSACYCTRHAVMDLQLLSGCCLWKGGVKEGVNTDNNEVLCNDGSYSETCTLEHPAKKVASW